MIDPEAIPQELKAYKQWVCWEYQERGGKATKVPINAKTGRLAKVDDSSTWADFRTAIKFCKKFKCEGIGFVLTEDDPFTFIDLDDIRDSETGDCAQWALDIMIRFDSYTELSPSETGAHIVVTGKLPPEGRRKGQIEIYENSRYMTLTGLVVLDKPIKEKQETLEKFHREIFGKKKTSQIQSKTTTTNPPTLTDDEIQEKASSANNGEKFNNLMWGEWAGCGYPSQSEADLALCCILAFYSRDTEQLDRLFRASELIRPKWDEKHYSNGKTYGQVTIEKALDQVTDSYSERSETPSKENIWSLAQSAPDFLSADDPEQDWLEPNMLAPGSITNYFSPRGIGKTLVGHGLGIRQARAGRNVLLLDRDNSHREVKRRLRGWGAEDVQTFKVLTRDQVPPLTDAKSWETFPFRDYDLLIIDSLDSTTEGVGEKDSAKPSKALAPILNIAHRPDGPAILILGNTVKSAQHGRGSGVIEDRADIVFEVRDATDLKPTGKKDWWLELPDAGVGEWAQRASRRKRRSKYRLAFIPTKFRVGEEPDPFIWEIDLSSNLWRLRDVTADVIHEGQATRDYGLTEQQQQMEIAIEELVAKVEEQSNTEEPLRAEEAVTFLMNEHEFTRNHARDTIDNHDREKWRIDRLKTRGRPKILIPITQSDSISNVMAVNKQKSGNVVSMRVSEKPSSATPVNTGRQKTESPEQSNNGHFNKNVSLPPKGNGKLDHTYIVRRFGGRTED